MYQLTIFCRNSTQQILQKIIFVVFYCLTAITLSLSKYFNPVSISCFWKYFPSKQVSPGTFDLFSDLKIATFIFTSAILTLLPLNSLGSRRMCATQSSPEKVKVYITELKKSSLLNSLKKYLSVNDQPQPQAAGGWVWESFSTWFRKPFPFSLGYYISVRARKEGGVTWAQKKGVFLWDSLIYSVFALLP